MSDHASTSSFYNYDDIFWTCWLHAKWKQSLGFLLYPPLLSTPFIHKEFTAKKVNYNLQNEWKRIYFIFPTEFHFYWCYLRKNRVEIGALKHDVPIKKALVIFLFWLLNKWKKWTTNQSCLSSQLISLIAGVRGTFFSAILGGLFWITYKWDCTSCFISKQKKLFLLWTPNNLQAF